MTYCRYCNLLHEPGTAHYIKPCPKFTNWYERRKFDKAIAFAPMYGYGRWTSKESNVQTLPKTVDYGKLEERVLAGKKK